jgi:hypothetical protein
MLRRKAKRSTRVTLLRALGIREIRIYEQADQIHRGHELAEQGQPLRAQAQESRAD